MSETDVYLISYVDEIFNPNIIDIEKVDNAIRVHDKSWKHFHESLFVYFGYAKCTNCIYFNNSYSGNKNTIYEKYKSIIINHKRVQKLKELYD